MATAESGSWKLLIYPIVVLIVVGVVLNLAVQPFIADGQVIENNPTFINTGWSNVVNSGNIFNMTEINILGFFVIPIPNIFKWIMPDSALNFLSEQIAIFSYIPSGLQIIIGAIIFICLAYSVWVLIAMLIP